MTGRGDETMLCRREDNHVCLAIGWVEYVTVLLLVSISHSAFEIMIGLYGPVLNQAQTRDLFGQWNLSKVTYVILT